MTFAQIAGILPAVVFPAATIVQLVRMVRARSAAGVSVATWLLFGFANLAIYIYAERYTEWQAIVGMLFTAVIDFVIVALALFRYQKTATAPHSDRPRTDRTLVHAVFPKQTKAA
ncbi:MAG: hypothetical protein NTV51_01320 [Verrucomicrobia bacterium]|nr:hypothetical protein [Verrucomicrobiota bacterium]